MKTIIMILFLGLFLNTQALAVVCSSECLLQENVEVGATKKHGCHDTSTKQISESSQNNNGCDSKICQLDELIIVDQILIDSNKCQKLVDSVSLAEIKFEFSYPILISDLVAKGPPEYGLYMGISIFVQNSSYII